MDKPAGAAADTSQLNVPGTIFNLSFKKLCIFCEENLLLHVGCTYYGRYCMYVMHLCLKQCNQKIVFDNMMK